MAQEEVPSYRQTFTVTIDCDDNVDPETFKRSLLMGLDHYGPWGIYGDDVSVSRAGS